MEQNRALSFISQNWYGQPLLMQSIAANLIAATITKGLIVKVGLDENIYEKGKIVSEKTMKALQITKTHLTENGTILFSPTTRSCYLRKFSWINFDRTDA